MAVITLLLAAFLLIEANQPARANPSEEIDLGRITLEHGRLRFRGGAREQMPLFVSGAFKVGLRYQVRCRGRRRCGKISLAVTFEKERLFGSGRFEPLWSPGPLRPPSGKRRFTLRGRLQSPELNLGGGRDSGVRRFRLTVRSPRRSRERAYTFVHVPARGNARRRALYGAALLITYRAVASSFILSRKFPALLSAAGTEGDAAATRGLYKDLIAAARLFFAPEGLTGLARGRLTASSLQKALKKTGAKLGLSSLRVKPLRLLRLIQRRLKGRQNWLKHPEFFQCLKQGGDLPFKALRRASKRLRLIIEKSAILGTMAAEAIGHETEDLLRRLVKFKGGAATALNLFLSCAEGKAKTLNRRWKQRRLLRKLERGGRLLYGTIMELAGFLAASAQMFLTR